MAKTDLTAEHLRELFYYDPETGCFTSLIGNKRTKKGDKAGCRNGAGYIQIGIDGSLYLCHRLAWLYTFGKWPIDMLDHCDLDRSNNKFSNLREATNAENGQNARKHSDNKSGFLGVNFHKHTNKWRAEICVNGKNKYLGLYATAEEASVAYLQEKNLLHTFNPVTR